MAATMTKPEEKKQKKWKSRAVTRPIEAGINVYCPGCGERIKFIARKKGKQVICNVYRKGIWQRVEHFHEECYVAQDEPYGPPQD